MELIRRISPPVPSRGCVPAMRAKYSGTFDSGPLRYPGMRRLLMVLFTALVLAAVSGCFNRPTDPVQKKEGEGNFDRLKNLQGSGKKDAKKANIGKVDAK